MTFTEEIRQLIDENKLEPALTRIEGQLIDHPHDDNAYYLRGVIYWKQGNWKLTIENYLRAIELNPDSPAQQAYHAVMEIINFSNPDMYNP